MGSECIRTHVCKSIEGYIEAEVVWVAHVDASIATADAVMEFHSYKLSANRVIIVDEFNNIFFTFSKLGYH